MADEQDLETESRSAFESVDLAVPLAIVGVGVAAASLQSLVRLFSALEPELGAAYLVTVRQREGLDVATVVDALGGLARFPVFLATDGQRLELNHVYVGAPDDLITVEDGHLRRRPSTEPLGHRGTLDSLLISLAEHGHEKAIAVLLSGLGSDGSAGLVATKKFGGLSIAEETEKDDLTAQGTSDPAAVADLNLPPERIAAEIVRYVGNLRPLLQEEEEDEETEDWKPGSPKSRRSCATSPAMISTATSAAPSSAASGGACWCSSSRAESTPMWSGCGETATRSNASSRTC